VNQKYDISIITVNFNGYKDTCELIESIPFDLVSEVIVVDNASKKDEASMLKDKYPQIKIVRSEKNLGFAGGNNLGIKVSTGRYLYFLNNDTVIKDFNVKSLVDRLESDSKIGMVCPKIRFTWANQPIQFAGYTPLSKITVRNQSIGFGEEDKGQYDEAHPTPYAHGAAMICKREVIEKAGMMPEDFFLYYEELDWSMMISRAGYQIWYDPGMTVFHKESQTTGQHSPLRTFYITRNRLLLVKRNFTAPVKYLSYLYLIFVVGLRDCIANALKGRFDLVKATLRGIHSFQKY